MPRLPVAAARNNASWVDAVARSHGVPTRSDGTAWRADGRMPPFYPNLVTLDPAVEPGPLLANPPRGAAAGWGLKDSFAALDLALQGFVPAFDAVWLARRESRASTGGAARVATPDSLVRWIRGWGETPQDAEIFLPSLLDMPHVRFYAVESEGKSTAGLAALLDAEVAGYSNAFGSGPGIAACLAALATEAGTRTLVGYEGDAAIAMMTALGFRLVGPLRIWASAPALQPASGRSPPG